MKKFLYLPILALTLFACTCDDTCDTEAEAEATAQVEVTATAVADKMMTMEVSGMMCKMNCGGSIKKALKSTTGVTDVEIDFEDGREINVAKVSFDSKLVNEQQMMEAVTSLYDNQYSVSNTSVSNLSQEISIDEEDVNSDEETSVVEAATSFIELPNLMDLFRGLFSV